MSLKTKIASILMFAVAAQAASAAVIVNENFDSYADTAAMKAVWGGTGNLGTLDTALSHSPSQSAAHPGGAVNMYLPGIGTVTPSATENLVFRAAIYDDAVAVNDRITAGIRTSAAPLFEMGRYNDFTPLPAIPVNTYGIRGLSLGNGITPSPGWVPFLNLGAPIPATAGWHTYEATFSILDGLTVTLDLGSNGSIDSTLRYQGNGTSNFGNFTDLRFGGPSNLTSAGGGANFDDIYLALVPIPEPTAAMMLGVLGLAGVRRRAR